MMVSPETYWLLGVLVVISSFLPPTIGYLRSIFSKSHLTRPDNHDYFPMISIILPIRNESKSIERKLSEITNSDYPKSKISLIVVDSCSSDNSIELAEGFFQNTETDLSWEILSLDKPGKSFAVNETLKKIDTEIFVMMDADASTKPRTIGQLVSWFQDPIVGGVCGCISEAKLGEKGYRDRFNKLRFSESIIDSTPIFEGSVCAFRIEAIGKTGIDPSINADDSQLAIMARRNGFRSIMDPNISFVEPDREKTTMRRKIRRAQGLSRTFWLNLDLCFVDNGSFTRIFRNQFYFHLIFPWLVICSSLLIISSSIFENIGGFDFSFNRFDVTLSLAPLLVLSRTSRTLISGIFALAISHTLIFFGIKLNIWDPGQRD